MQITEARYEVIKESLATRVNTIESKVGNLRYRITELLSDMSVAKNRGFDVPEAVFLEQIEEINALIAEIKTAAETIELYGANTMTILEMNAQALQDSWDAE